MYSKIAVRAADVETAERGRGSGKARDGQESDEQTGERHGAIVPVPDSAVSSYSKPKRARDVQRTAMTSWWSLKSL